MDPYHVREIWGRLDHVQWSYNNFLFHGEWPKMAATPRQGRSMKNQGLNNFRWS